MKFFSKILRVLLCLILSTQLFAQNAIKPYVLLNPEEETFIVFSSTTPYRVTLSDNDPYIQIDSDKGKFTEPKAIKINGNSQNGQLHFNAIRIDLTSKDGKENDVILIPIIALPNHGKESEEKLAGLIPLKYINNVSKKFFTLTISKTPAGHLFVEIIDSQTLRMQDQKNEKILKNKSQSRIEGTNALGYEIVFPWLGLEYVSLARNAEVERQDVVPNVDAVNAVSYERYSMSNGTWSALNVSDPTSWIRQNNLQAWPMLIGNQSETSVLSMWNNRAALADQMVQTANTQGFKGYCVDVEGTASNVTHKNNFINLVNYLAQQLHVSGLKLMVCHATWATLAPISDLAATAVDYVATMDPYTNSIQYYKQYIANDYAAISPARLIWGFCWELHNGTSQNAQWEWMKTSGYNNNVAGAAAWRTPATATNGINYYQGFRTYYPASTTTGSNIARNAIGWQASSTYSSAYDGTKAYDGSISAASKWTSSGTTTLSWLTLDLGSNYSINGFKVYHAGAVGEPQISNTKAYRIDYGNSFTGPWTAAVSVDNTSQQNITSSTLASNITCRYIRLYITNPGADNYARIPEFEIYGTPGNLVTPTNLQRSLPTCGNSGYNVTFSWQGSGPGWWVDVSADPSFATSNLFHKKIDNLTSTTSADLCKSFQNCSEKLVLQPNTTYYWRIFNSQQHFAGSAFTVPSCSGSCIEPVSFSSNGITSSSATVSWNPVSGATGYNVAYRPSADANWIQVYSNSSSTTLTGLQANTQYVYIVTTWCGSNYSPWSVPVYFSTTGGGCSGLVLNASGVSNILWPFANSSYTSPGGWRVTCGPGCGAHQNSDYWADDWSTGNSCGLEFKAPISGTVIYSGWVPATNPNGGETKYGNQIVIQSQDNPAFAFRVAHLSVRSVSVNAVVTAGSKIGEIGTTGNSSGCHAHCVLYKNLNASTTSVLKNGGFLGSINNAAQFFYNGVCNSARSKSFAFDQQKLIALPSPIGVDESSPTLKVHPNPFNKSTIVEYRLARDSKVALEIWDSNNRLIKKLADHELQKAGDYKLDLQGNNLKSGIYILKLQIGDQIINHRIAVL